MNSLFLITGAAGHLGSTVVRKLAQAGHSVRGLILPGECPEPISGVNYVEGDVCDRASLLPFFEGATGASLIHTAGIIDITADVSARMRAVNIGGTRNILSLCRTSQVSRLVYVSSVHAIPEQRSPHVLHEIDHFSPDTVVGGYAKTKAAATQEVLDAAAAGLDAVVVHPSGILGPFDRSGNHLVQMVADYVAGKLPACVRGGYDFVDVRDVAGGCIAAAEHGRTGECYILSGRHYEIKEVLQMVKEVQGGRRLPVLPLWMAKLAAPAFEWVASKRRRRPLYTSYSLYTLGSNDRFSHDKATRELGFLPRDLFATIQDTVLWLKGSRQLAL